MKNAFAETPSSSLPPWIRAIGLIAAVTTALFAQSRLLGGEWLQAFLLYFVAGTITAIVLRGKWNATPEPIASHVPIRWDAKPLWVAVCIVLGVCSATAAAWGAGRSDGALWMRLSETAWLSMLASMIFASREAFIGSTRRLLRRAWAPLAALAIFAFWIGTWRLTQIPRSVHGDEGMIGLHARHILYGQIETLFSSSWYMLPQFFFAPPAACMAIFGDDLFGLRISAVLFGTGSVLCLYATARVWWGDRVALLTAILYLCDQWQLFLMRSGVQYGQAAFYGIATLALWSVCNRRRSLSLCLLSGGAQGFALMSYQANHLLPLLWIVSQVYLWLTGRIDKRWLFASIFVPLITAALTIAPLLAHDYVKVGSVQTFTSRSTAITVLKPDNWSRLEIEYDAPGDPLRIWANQLTRAFLAPFVVLDRSGQFDGSAPMLNPVAASLLGLAVLLALTRLRDPRWAIPLIWSVLVFLIGGAFAIENPFYPRFAGALPMLSLLIAAMAAQLFGVAFAWTKTLRMMWMAAVIALIIASASLGLRQFFDVYAKIDGPRNVHYAQTRLAERIAQFPKGTPVFVLYGLHVRFNSGTVRFVAKDAIGRDVADLEELLFWYEGKKPALVLIAPNRTEAIGPLLRRFPFARSDMHRRPNGDLLFYEVLIQP